MKQLPKGEHPKGLPTKDRKEWHESCLRLFELYKKMPVDAKFPRKIVAGSEEETNEGILVFLRGTLKI